jgi:predicted dehydrogenase
VSSTRYEVLIVGCGKIAGGFDMTRPLDLPPLSHAGAYTRHGGFRLLACIDPNDERRQAFAKYWGVHTHAPDLVTLGAAPSAFDVISICSPTTLHHEHLTQALALRPRVIFCEKPLTSDVASAAALVKDCRAQGTYLVVNYSRRWDPAVAELANQLRDGRWGAIRSVVGYYNKGISNNGGHMVDLLFRLVGPLELVATTRAEFDFWDSDPTVAALLTAAKGAIPVYLSPAHARDYAYFELEIVCAFGVVRMQSGGMGWHYRDAVPSVQFAGYQTLDSARKIKGRYLETMTGAIEEIHGFLHEGKTVESSGENALLVQELCAKIHREATRKRTTSKLISR